ncbi:hypothetical protein [Aeromicrobium massiliense]|uniref:hypothetical protein n=1 Tax=Aeromicrobium massiliense TaxID=1464554 RepID=UPI0002DA73EA|nr:hypothetical protein [Aeromicrobium massiliense]
MVVRQALARTLLVLLVLVALLAGVFALEGWTSEPTAGTQAHEPLPVAGGELVAGLSLFLLVPGAVLFALFVVYGRWRETAATR